MTPRVPPFRIVIPCVQVYLLLLAICCGLLGLMYADISFLDGVVAPAVAFALWGGLPGWMFVRLMKYHFTVPPEHYKAILWTLPAFYTPLVAAVYILCQPLYPFILLPVLLVALGYICLLVGWYWAVYHIYCSYYKRNPWAAY